MEENLSFGEFIPRAVINTKLSRGLRDVLAKITLLDIAGRCTDHGGCYAGNKYIATVLGMATTTVAKYISRLRKDGFIEQISFDGRVRVIRSTLHDAVVMERAQYKLSKIAETHPSQNGTAGQGRGVQPAQSAKDNRGGSVRTKDRNKKTLNVCTSEKNKFQGSTWEDFLKWSGEHLTRSSVDTLQKVKVHSSETELKLLTPIPESLQMIIKKYFREEIKNPIAVTFETMQNEGRAA
ncbi:helix-turn-helix domain-containing protein [Leptospira santarosai]|uniref:helix-turn-helix domain-containing protein n=1 Tax=Leptospira santarosai TaxID=28183 RepID=UPI0024AFDC1E|nr:helix-turn-helix domain-containing protein [Leptospira santarosai]MDI7183617.1 helix-turn-helix domain-containing protein [Leptospira santarosai]